MAEHIARTNEILDQYLVRFGHDALFKHPPRPFEEPPRRIDRMTGTAAEKFEQRWQALGVPDDVRAEIADPASVAMHDTVKRNIENYVGSVKVPVGVAGPVRVHGLHARGDYFVPMATTEAALVASYNRGCALINAAGGATALLVSERVLRTPMYAFFSIAEAGAFIAWVTSQHDRLKEAAESTTRFGKLIDLKVHLEGSNVYLIFGYTTGDASGQNMVTIATEAACKLIDRECPIKPRFRFVEANMSGDKKTTTQSLGGVRGKKVVVEIVIANHMLQQFLKTTSHALVHLWRSGLIGCLMSGVAGGQSHLANALAAIYIATGQDAACVAESAVGVVRFETRDNDDLYASLTMSNLMVGTVGGGTGLPSQKACLEIMGLYGSGKAKALAEVLATVCLAGELSIMGAVSAGDFTRAHKLKARG